MDVPIPCPCPPRADGSPRHPGGDTVTLREALGFHAVRSIKFGIGMLDRDGSDESYAGEILAILTEGYIVHGIESWTLADAKGRPLPVSRGAIRSSILENLAVADTVGDAADGMYGKVILPLMDRASTSSQPSPTGRLTSPPTGSPTRRPRPSRPSSTTTSPTAATATTTTSLAGAYSSSLSSESAA